MLTRRLTMVAVAAAFAASSSLAMLQSSRPALADADDHHPKVHRTVVRDHDRDDRRVHRAARPGYHWSNGQWIRNNYANVNNPGKHKGWKQKKNHDRDHDRR